MKEQREDNTQGHRGDAAAMIVRCAIVRCADRGSTIDLNTSEHALTTSQIHLLLENRMNVQYWPVGASTPTPLPLTIDEISKHLLADWVPSLPISLGSAFLGWPVHLIERIFLDSIPLWSIHDRVRGTERQWKSVLSWMLGVSGTRHVLEDEGYRWIAPLSAFYGGSEIVDLTRWNSDFPRTLLRTSGDPASRAKLRPDYLALRLNTENSKYSWAAVESKGTRDAIASRSTCRPDWYEQARNVRVEFDGQGLEIDRHLVVATRVNPNALRSRTRCIQIRAWNSSEKPDREAPLTAAVDVASAHLFGLCRNLRLVANAQAIALAIQARSLHRDTESRSQAWRSLRDVIPRAENELREITGLEGRMQEDLPRGHRDLVTELGRIEIELEPATVSLIRALGTEDTNESAAKTLVATERKLNASLPPLEVRRKDRLRPLFSDGVHIRVPEEFSRRE